MHQLWVRLFESGKIKTRSRNGISMLPFKAGYVVGNFVIDSADPLGLNSKRKINQEGAKEATNHLTDHGFLACV